MAATRTKMVNARVSEQAAGRAACVLEREGLTISSFIRDAVEYVSQTNQVPQFCKEATAKENSQERLKGFLRQVEEAPMPGRAEFAGLDEEQMVRQIRMERYGY